MGRETLTEDDPQSIGSYWLTARLGDGGQGVVYEAYDAAGTRCAVKVLRTHSASRSPVQQRFAKEVAAAERVASFCAAKVLDADPQAEPPYMVSEFVGGPDLGAAVSASGPMEGDALLRLVTGVATALTAIHGAGVVHRDLKPANVLLGPDGPRVIDFGIARTQDMSLTATGEVMGTPAYMAPEVLRGERADDRADVFAWGAITLFAATGRSPFLGRTPSETVVRVTEHQPELEPLPVPLRPLVEAALSKDPGGRPSSGELLLGLLSAEGSASGAAEGEASELLAAGARSAAEVRAPADSPEVMPELGTLAESAYGELSAPEREFAQAALLRLVVPGEAGDGSQDTVRTAARDELLLRLPLDERPVGQSVLDRLVAAGVLLDEGHRVRPAGAGLLRAWPRLRDWKDEHRAALRVMQRTSVAARAWERGARDPEDLPRGDALRTALEWAANAPGAVRPNSLEREYLDAGRAAVTRAVRRRHRRRAGVATLVVAVLAVGTVAWQLQRSNNEQQAEAASREVATAAESMRSSDPRTAKLLSAAAWRLAPTHEARAALYGTAWQAESDIRTNPADSVGALSDDGTTLVSFNEGERLNRVQRWDARTGKTLSTATRSLDVPDSGEAAHPVISPEGRFAAHTNTRGGGRSTVRDLETGGKLTDRAPGTPMALSKGGRHVLGHSAGGEELRVYDTREETTVLRVPFSDAPTAFSDDGSVLAVCQPNKSPTLYWPGSGKKRALEEGACGTSPTPDDEPATPVSLDLSPDGERLVLADSQQPDGHEDLVQWRTATGESLAGGDRVFPEDVGDPALRAESSSEKIGESEDSTFYSSDGRTLIHTTEDAISVADPSTPDRALLKATYSGNKQGVSFDAARRQLRSLSPEEIRSFPVPKVPSTLRGASDQGVFSPDASTLLLQEVSAEDPSEVNWRAWDAERGKRRAQPVLRQGPQVEVIKPVFGPSVAFHPDGHEVSYGTDKRTVRQDTRTGKVTKLPGDSPQRLAATLAYGPEGRVLAVSHQRVKPYTEVWREGRDTPRVLKGVGEGDVAVGGSAGHEVLVTSRGHLVDLRTGERRTRIFGQSRVENVEFSPDGQTLAASQEDGWIQLWNGDVTRRLGGMPSEEAEQQGLDQFSADRLRFSPDGRTLAARVDDERVQLFDVPGRKPLGAAHPGLGGAVLDLAFDGNDRLRVATESVRLDTVDIDPDRLADRVCDGAESGLTRAQWERHVPDGVPYREVCA